MPDEKEIEDIKKLPPQERIKKLKELEDKRKKQEEESKKVLEQSIKELKLDEMLKEIEVPKNADVNIDKLFRQVKEVDEVSAEKLKKARAIEGQEYGKRIEALLPRDKIDEIQHWYTKTSEPSKAEFLEVYDDARRAYDLVRQDMQKVPNQEFYSAPSQALVEEVVSSMRLLRSMGYKMNWLNKGP